MLSAQDIASHACSLVSDGPMLPTRSSIHLRMMPPAAGSPMCMPSGMNLQRQLVRLFEKGRSFIAETYRAFFTLPFWSGIIESSTGNISSFIPCRFYLVSSKNLGWTREEALTLTRSSLVLCWSQMPLSSNENLFCPSAFMLSTSLYPSFSAKHSARLYRHVSPDHQQSTGTAETHSKAYSK